MPIIGILALSYQSPKFNPRYILVAWPAFALLLTGSLSRLQVAGSTLQVKGLTFNLQRLTLNTLRLAFILFIILLSAYSLTNWFSDRRFAKDDFKALAQFVRERRAPDETILLSSGHLYPVWAYYYGWEGWTPLPQMERLDVNRTLNLDAATDLKTALNNQGGLWLVNWQDEVTDPTGVIPFWLDRIGSRPDDAGDFQGVRLEHWRLDPTKMERLEQTPIRHPVEAGSTNESAYNFANQLDLLGMTQLSDQEIVLFWRPRQPLPDDLLLTFNLTDRDGFTWSQETTTGRPGAYLYPPSRWPVGQITLTRHPLNWQPGTPPGLYQAEVGLGQPVDQAAYQGWDILDAQGRPQRRTALIQPVNLSRLVPASPPAGESPLVDFSPLVTLRQSQLSAKTAEPGDSLRLMLWWQAGEFNLDDISVAFDLVDSTGQSFRVGSSLTPSRNFNLPRWSPGEVVVGQYQLNLPPQIAPGPATLRLHLVNVHGYPYDEVFDFDQLEILPTQRNFTPPATVDMPLKADFSGQVSLLGADCRATDGAMCRAAPGQPVTLTLYWRADTPPAADYTIFTHLLGPGETLALNVDHAPPKPMPGWVPREIITDTVTLALPVNLSPGDYPIEVGLYNAAEPDLPRLPLSSGETRLILPQSLRVE